MEAQPVGSSDGTEGWDEEWEDFTQMPAPPKPTAIRSTTSKSNDCAQSGSKPLKLVTNRTPSPALFEDVGSWTSATSATRKTTSLPPVPLGLFAVQEKRGGEERGGGGVEGGGAGGWGDWGDEDIGSMSDSMQVRLYGRLLEWCIF